MAKKPSPVLAAVSPEDVPAAIELLAAYAALKTARGSLKSGPKDSVDHALLDTFDALNALGVNLLRMR